MGRESAARRYRGFAGKRCCLLVCFAIFFLILPAGCTTGLQQKFHISDPWREATLPLSDSRIDEAISNLKSLLDNPDYACRAAFYLFAFDGAKDQYIRIIRSETCKQKTPGEAKLLERLLAAEEKLLELKSGYKKQQSKVSALHKETQNLEKELSRLRFELQKMEEIRRETEKWRVQ